MEKPLTSEVLSASFKAFWSQLATGLASLPADSSPTPTARPEREILEEILATVRGQNQRGISSGVMSSQHRRALGLIGFAQGILKGRKLDGAVTAQPDGEDLLLFVKTTEAEFHIQLSSMLKTAEARDLIQEAIVHNTFSDDDIPF